MLNSPPGPPARGESILRWCTALYNWLLSLRQEVNRQLQQQNSRRLGVYASDLQFGAIQGPVVSGVPYVTVYKGWHLTPYGAASWPASGESDDIEITGTGWVITRQAKGDPAGSVSVVFQATQANPLSTTHYESDVVYVDYDAGAISLSYANPGERNFVATV